MNKLNKIISSSKVNIINSNRNSNRNNNIISNIVVQSKNFSLLNNIYNTQYKNFSSKSKKSAVSNELKQEIDHINQANKQTKVPKDTNIKYNPKQTSHDENKLNIIESMKPFKEQFATDQEKKRRAELLKQEITSNPEFFKAFPHLKVALDVGKEEFEGFEVAPMKKTKQSDYFGSLLHKYNDNENLTRDEIDNTNDDRFVDAFTTRDGPKKYLSKEDKERIHQEIDVKMQELEDSGLSREEIMFGKPIGVPLVHDKYFQFLKKNKVAREMLIKPYESLSADTVIEKALKQDIGPDNSKAVNKSDLKYKDQLSQNYDTK